jgi:hypothetical protein
MCTTQIMIAFPNISMKVPSVMVRGLLLEWVHFISSKHVQMDFKSGKNQLQVTLHVCKGVNKGKWVLIVGLVITGFVLLQIPPQDPQILCNYGRRYHYHLSRILPRFSDGRGPPQRRLPW